MKILQLRLKNRINSFTLIEILTVIAIIVLLTTAAIPGWRNFVQNNQAVMLAAKLANTFTLARTTAIQSGQTITVCPIAQPAGTTCVSTTAWDAWVVFTDINSNGTFATGSGEKYYRDQPAGSITASSTGVISFNPAGFYSASADIAFIIKPTGCTGSNGRIITIMPSGNVYTTTTTCP